MIFIGGISNGVKQLYYGRKMFCRYCGELSQISLVMTYTYFSFFFIPLFKWNKRFYLEFRCCRRQYEVPYETGMRILNGEDVEISPSELVLVGRGDYQQDEAVHENHMSPAPLHEEDTKKVYDKRYCSYCGSEIDTDFKYCPYCGNKL